MSVVSKVVLVAAVAAATAAATSGSAHASVCVGTANTVVVCTDPTGTTYVQDCVYLGGDTCTPVVVNGPTVSCGGDIGARLCASIGTGADS
jgi:hypothetical protein